MKVMIVSAHHSRGGAARAAYRLYDALRKNGENVEYKAVFHGERSRRDRLRYLVRGFYDRFPAFALTRKRLMFSDARLPNPALVRELNESDADVIHLHWMHSGALSMSDVARIRKPVLWTMHDNWLFTGGCHIKYECRHFENGCGQCPLLGSEKPHDRSWTNAQVKRRVFERKPVTVLGLSRWMISEASRSYALRGNAFVTLPNPIDTKRFEPRDRAEARSRLGLPQDRKLILFGANAALQDPNKGYDLLLAALAGFTAEEGVELVAFGAEAPAEPLPLAMPYRFVGFVSDDSMLADLYSACDVTVVPSRQENLSNAIMESLACASPVVAFDVGGNADQIEHLRNGYLAQPHDLASLSEGIRWVLRHEAPETLAAAARSKVMECFDSDVVARRYVELYRQIMTRQEPATFANATAEDRN